MKGSRYHDGKFVNLVMHEEEEPLCPISLFTALAFADDVFESGIHSFTDLRRLKIPEGKGSLLIPFKQSALPRYLFRLCDTHGVSERPSTVLQMGALLKDLGQRASFQDQLSFYNMRRESPRRLDERGTPAQRKHAMGHNSEEIYQSYISKTVAVDIQSAFRRHEARTKLVDTALSMSLRRDSRAPTSLSKSERKEILGNKELVAMKSELKSVEDEIRRQYGSLEAAAGPDLLKEYKRLGALEQQQSAYIS
ncbi:hypothetical protein L873DRAFT_1052954 [Choiromyces venosus 120613-1]|uniref:Uncharacterized protein n=1 Tax=Choiromyces venosus 120613-1 TaxID=1336337 RepID=A0A3N4JIN8_9PEZI|nr:hypothetical protein L873DRAFT_1052954 [Choiromyces venosus 120613-1]